MYKKFKSKGWREVIPSVDDYVIIPEKLIKKESLWNCIGNVFEIKNSLDILTNSVEIVCYVMPINGKYPIKVNQQTLTYLPFKLLASMIDYMNADNEEDAIKRLLRFVPYESMPNLSYLDDTKEDAQGGETQAVENTTTKTNPFTISKVKEGVYHFSVAGNTMTVSGTVDANKDFWVVCDKKLEYANFIWLRKELRQKISKMITTSSKQIVHV